MDGFAVYGYSSVAAAVACGVLVFLTFRRRLSLPWILNLPGALLVTAGVFLLAGWLFTVTGVTERTLPDFPGVPWTSSAGVLVLAACWYQMIRMGLKAWREHQGKTIK